MGGDREASLLAQKGKGRWIWFTMHPSLPFAHVIFSKIKIIRSITVLCDFQYIVTRFLHPHPNVRISFSATRTPTPATDVATMI